MTVHDRTRLTGQLHLFRKTDTITMNHDVFNGDADGICALHQLRLAFPAANNLVTGTKREIDLLRRVEAGPGDEVTVLDLALSRNRDALLALLGKGAKVSYFDHHVSEDIPDHPNLTVMIDTRPDVCTSLLVNRHLSGRHLVWAVVGAFGDNLHEAAYQAAKPLGLSHQQLATLRELGECINYNSYGESVEDLHFHPAELYRILHQFKNPFVFINENGIFEILKQGYAEDMALARAIHPEHETASGAVYILPAKPWSRRVSGAFGNVLASAAHGRAHAVLTQRGDGAFVVSVRAPQSSSSGADTLCSRFATGGGRKKARQELTGCRRTNCRSSCRRSTRCFLRDRNDGLHGGCQSEYTICDLIASAKSFVATSKASISCQQRRVVKIMVNRYD